jgi:hypothetical protein
MPKETEIWTGRKKDKVNCKIDPDLKTSYVEIGWIVEPRTMNMTRLVD